MPGSEHPSDIAPALPVDRVTELGLPEPDQEAILAGNVEAFRRPMPDPDQPR